MMKFVVFVTKARQIAASLNSTQYLQTHAVARSTERAHAQNTTLKIHSSLFENTRGYDSLYHTGYINKVHCGTCVDQ